MTDGAVLARQEARQAEGRAVLADLDIPRRIEAIGAPTQSGSMALGLLVARDIDITTLCPSLDVDGVFGIGADLAHHPRVRRLTWRNDTGRWNVSPDYPDGLYWLVEYLATDGSEWTLDLWFLQAGTTQFDLEDLERLPPRLTPEVRAAILRIKEARVDLPGPRRSHRIYEAVLDHGIRTPADFERYLDGKA